MVYFFFGSQKHSFCIFWARTSPKYSWILLIQTQLFEIPVILNSNPFLLDCPSVIYYQLFLTPRSSNQRGATVFPYQGCGVRKITRSSKVPNHEILRAQHRSLHINSFSSHPNTKVSCLWAPGLIMSTNNILN